MWPANIQELQNASELFIQLIGDDAHIDDAESVIDGAGALRERMEIA